MGEKYFEFADQIIRSDRGKLVLVNKMKIENLLEGEKNTPIKVICVAGNANTGKSFLLNLLINFFENGCQNLGGTVDRNGGFPVGYRMGATFCNLRVYPKIFVRKNYFDKKVGFLLMEAQGIFDGVDGNRCTSILFRVCNAISSTLILNTLDKKIPASVITNILGSLECQKTHGCTDLVFLMRDTCNKGSVDSVLYKFEDILPSAFIEDFDKIAKKKSLNLVFKSVIFSLLPEAGNDVINKRFSGLVKSLPKNFLRSLNTFFQYLTKSADSVNTGRLLTGDELIQLINNMTVEGSDNIKIEITASFSSTAEGAHKGKADFERNYIPKQTDQKRYQSCDRSRSRNNIVSGNQRISRAKGAMNQRYQRNSRESSVGSTKSEQPCLSDLADELLILPLQDNSDVDSVRSSPKRWTESQNFRGRGDLRGRGRYPNRSWMSRKPNINLTTENSAFSTYNTQAHKAKGPRKPTINLMTEKSAFGPGHEKSVEQATPSTSCDTGELIVLAEPTTDTKQSTSASNSGVSKARPYMDLLTGIDVVQSLETAEQYYYNRKTEHLETFENEIKLKKEIWAKTDDSLNQIKEFCTSFIDRFTISSENNSPDIFEKYKISLVEDIKKRALEEAFVAAKRDYIKHVLAACQKSPDDIKRAHEDTYTILYLQFLSFWKNDAGLLASILQEEYYEISRLACVAKLQSKLESASDAVDLYDLDCVVFNEYFPPSSWHDPNNKVEKLKLKTALKTNVNKKALEILKEEYDKKMKVEVEDSMLPSFESTLERLHNTMRGDLLSKMRKVNPGLVDELGRELNNRYRHYVNKNQEKLDKTKNIAGAAAAVAGAVAFGYSLLTKPSKQDDDKDGHNNRGSTSKFK